MISLSKIAHQIWRDRPFIQQKKQDNRMNEQLGGGWKQHRRGRGLEKI